MTAVRRTTPPGRAIVLYDGACRFCVAASQRMAGVAPRGAVERRDFRAPGALDDLPGLDATACEEALHLVTADGRVAAGAEAVARLVAMRPLGRVVAALYFVPGLRQVADAAYRWIARRRARLFGRTGACDGTCRLR